MEFIKENIIFGAKQEDMIGIKEEDLRSLIYKMIKYYDKFITSIGEINNSPTLLIHSLCGCNLKCCDCFNYEELVIKKHDNFYNINDIIYHLKLNAYLYDYIILSGGEFLINDLNDIIKDIKQIKKITSSPIIIYTNGTFPLKIKKLLKSNIIDGIHTDMKLPFQYLQYNTDKEIILKTLGINISQKIINNILLSLEYTIQFDKGLNQVRSVKYPFLDKSVFEDNKLYIQELNLKYKKNVPYKVNEFIKKGEL